MTDDQTNGERADPLANVKNWLIVFAISIGVFALTYSPLLAMTMPYLRAGWPAFQTGCWLRKADPWPARGRVGFYFHLAMAGFRAGVVGAVTLLLMIWIEGLLKLNLDFTQGEIALCVILAGVCLSFSCGWWGTLIAFRNRIRVFVISDLKHLCHGDFLQVVRLPMHKYRVNPANYVMAVALAVPLLALWFVAMLLTMAKPGEPDPQAWVSSVLLASLLPGTIFFCLVLLFFLRRLIAQTPLECWGAVPPNKESVGNQNWYRMSE